MTPCCVVMVDKDLHFLKDKLTTLRLLTNKVKTKLGGFGDIREVLEDDSGRSKRYLHSLSLGLLPVEDAFYI